MSYKVIKEKHQKKADGTFELLAKYGANAEDVDRSNGKTVESSLAELENNKLNKNGDGKDVTVSFLESSTRTSLLPNENLSKLFGKIAKYFSDLKTVAFTGKAADIEEDDAHKFTSTTEKAGWNGKVTASGGDISETIVKTLDNVTESFPIPAAGEKPKTFLSKVKKNLQDWKNLKDTLLTLSKLVNNGQTTATGYALDARYGKTLYDLYTQLNSNLIYRLLSSNFNANNLTGGDSKTICYYFYNEIAAGSLNLPVTTSGLFIVKRYGVNILQTVIQASTGVSYTRQSNNTGTSWAGWERQIIKSDLQNLTYNYDGTKGKAVYEVGTIFTGGASNTIRTSKITFKTQFTSPPRILISDITSDPSLQRSSVKDAGISGFTLCTKRTDTERADVFWVAVGT